jgi:hypothetical protein
MQPGESVMTKIRLTVLCVAILFLLAFPGASAIAAETLKDKLGESGWDGIIGTWVDADTQGNSAKVSYAWKIEDRVIEVTSKMGEKESVALMGVNGKTGEVFHMGADSDGTSSLGKWEVEDSGDAVLGVLYTTADGQEGGMSIRFQKEGKDAVTMTIELPQPIRVNLVRAK